MFLLCNSRMPIQIRIPSPINYVSFELCNCLELFTKRNNTPGDS